jgi:hypothetical protein
MQEHSCLTVDEASAFEELLQVREHCHNYFVFHICSETDLKGTLPIGEQGRGHVYK